VELLFQRYPHPTRVKMNDLPSALATTLDTVSSVDAMASAPAPVEFVGSSDHTIAEAVRRALSRASRTLRTLDGAGVMVIPQIARKGSHPRFNVTLRVSPSANPPVVHVPER
jgi:flavin-binding protein dodecin